jgi:hypothetical protein
MDTKFDKNTQDLLNNLLQKQNRDTLTAKGVPITTGNEYMAHYIGPTATAAVYRNKDSSKTVAEVMAAANLTPPGKTNNPELYTIKAVDFEKILSDRLTKKMAPHSSGQTIGNSIDESSKQNKELHEQLNTSAGGSNTINQTNVNVSSPQQQRGYTPSVDERSAYERKSRIK